MVKEQFHEADEDQNIESVKFLVGNADFIRQAAHIRVVDPKLYEDILPGKWQPTSLGPLSARLGTCQKDIVCETCKSDLEKCVGHFGYIDLPLPIFHVGFFNLLIRVVQCICKSCSGLLVIDPIRKKFLEQIRRAGSNYLTRKSIHKSFVLACKKVSVCPHCEAKNGIIKRAIGVLLKIAHGKTVSADTSQQYTKLVEETKEMAKFISNSKFELLDAYDVYKILDKISVEDFPLLMISLDEQTHPLDLLITRLPVPPCCIRPSVVSELKSGTTEDDITVKLTEILFIIELLQDKLESGHLPKACSETWDQLQLHCSLYINSEMSGLPLDMQQKKTIRGFTQRMKGKQGRFRGNLSGKRVDFSGRTVISPDPNLKIDQVGVPIYIAKILTFPEIVNEININRMRELIINGESVHPGANQIIDSSTKVKRFLRFGNRQNIAAQLKCGDIVERHLADNDVVLFNRQPSLHKVSIMAHRVKVVPGRTFRFNECACTPYNADFDGDEMNLHVPRTYDARAEASQLMSVKRNLLTPRSGEPLVAAIQDFITSGYLLTHKDSFFTRSEVNRFASALIDVNEKKSIAIHIPRPAILKPLELWTGKQLVEFIIRPDVNSNIVLNLSTRNKSYTKNEEFCVKDSYVIIRNSVLLCGVLDKSLLGSGSKTNIFYILLRDYGEDAAVDAMWRLARLAPVFLSNRGFSVGIGDVRPGKELLIEKSSLVKTGYEKCDSYISSLETGELKAQPGCTPQETLEALSLKELSSIRDHIGQACLRNLSSHNAPLIMAVSGSKGSNINISQMIACVGQQAISGHRPSDGFEERCLPHFVRKEKTPAAKGFVENSFFSGLTPSEFFFHTMAGREGLVDTAVKTAETGYMQRRLVKCLEDLCVAYDGTVRTSYGDIIQFTFGEDGLDPVQMEAKDGSVVDFKHALEHIRNTIPFSWYEDSDLETEEMRILLDSTVKMKAKSQNLLFWENLKEFISDYLQKSSKYYAIQKQCPKHAHKKSVIEIKCKDCQAQAEFRRKLVIAHCLSHSQAVAFVEFCDRKLLNAIAQAGTAAGAIAATSIGEPSTQMTLKTFHFAGVASMNITQGVPRIKEIINAVKSISTPVITASLLDEHDENMARRVKARIEKTTLGEICQYIEEVYKPDDCFILLKLDIKRIRLLQLEITRESIRYSILAAKFAVPIKHDQVQIMSKSIILIRPPTTSKYTTMMALHYIKYNIGNVVVKGLSGVTRCIVHADEKKGDSYKLLVEGTDFKGVMATMGIDGRRTVCNNAITIAQVLGIEAARTSIIKEILSTMESHGIGLDRRHVMLLADLMTSRGEVLGITRNGLVRMKESVFLLASFERTTDHLFEAAFFKQKDNIVGVSESIIIGKPISIGTGLFDLLHVREPLKQKKRCTIFREMDFHVNLG